MQNLERRRKFNIVVQPMTPTHGSLRQANPVLNGAPLQIFQGWRCRDLHTIPHSRNFGRRNFPTLPSLVKCLKRLTFTPERTAKAMGHGNWKVQIDRALTLSSTKANRPISSSEPETLSPNEPPVFWSTDISLTNLPSVVNSTISLG
jgi:hypothetical protein